MGRRPVRRVPGGVTPETDDEVRFLRDLSAPAFEAALKAEGERMRALAQATGIRQDATARLRRGEALTPFQRMHWKSAEVALIRRAILRGEDF